MHSVLIFGGTFDPVHNGHIRVAMAVCDRFHFERVLFLPCKIPVLKNQAQASPEQRVTMLRLALNEHPEYPFEIDERELKRSTPSYTVDTLEDFRQQLGEDVSINFMLGADSFASLPEWHNWKRILSLANLLVIERPGYVNQGIATNELLAQYQTHSEQELKNRPHGLIYTCNAGLHDISSTHIRTGRKQKRDLPVAVNEYIEQQGLY